MLLKSVYFGSTMPPATTGNDGVPKGTLKIMRLALCAKALVVTFEFFAAIFDGYNCAQDEHVLTLFLCGATIATAIKVSLHVNAQSLLHLSAIFSTAMIHVETSVIQGAVCWAISYSQRGFASKPKYAES
nr:uncharacterized protein LOC129383183 [Dermacentor andersoni]